jgi:hypothetical protein
VALLNQWQFEVGLTAYAASAEILSTSRGKFNVATETRTPFTYDKRASVQARHGVPMPSVSAPWFPR